MLPLTRPKSPIQSWKESSLQHGLWVGEAGEGTARRVVDLDHLAIWVYWVPLQGIRRNGHLSLQMLKEEVGETSFTKQALIIRKSKFTGGC